MIIGLAGRKGSGKDTAAEVFVAGGYQHLKMATPLKMMLVTLLRYQGVDPHIIPRMIEGDLKEMPTAFLGGHSPRHAMQTLGTEWGRDQMGADFWVDIFLNTAAQFTHVICSDIRFPNELAACDLVYRIERPQPLAGDGHASESHIDELPVDAVFMNEAPSAQHFQAQVKAWFSAAPSPGSSLI